jgi:NADH dehydrogenase (ubiquinone) 1 beta subcomplex subunit 7
MSDAKLPLAYRDSCAHLLIPLNKCRPANWYLPWKCQVRPPANRRIYSSIRYSKRYTAANI